MRRSFILTFATLCGFSCAQLDLLKNASTWSMPARVSRCPLHKPFVLRTGRGEGFWLDPPGGGKFSVAESELPSGALNVKSTGLRLRYTANPGAPGVSLWRLRLSTAHSHIRFVVLFSIPADGVTNKTLYVPWSEFRGQKMDLRNKRILECPKKPSAEDECAFKPADMTHISLLESEDTVAHSIWLQELSVVSSAIDGSNMTDHHTAAEAAALWEREHAYLSKLGHHDSEFDLLSPGSTSWSAPSRVQRCTLHANFTLSAGVGGGIWFDPPGGGKFSVAEAELPSGKRFGRRSTGLRLRYSAKPGATGSSLWRLRVTSSAWATVRFAALFSIPPGGVTNKTLYIPWTEFRAQLLDPKNKRILPCDWRQNSNCFFRPEAMTHISFLESEDTVAHAIWLQDLFVVSYNISEVNAVPHHSAEEEKALWEREHAYLQHMGQLNSDPSDDNMQIVSNAYEGPFTSSTLLFWACAIFYVSGGRGHSRV